MLAAGGGGSGQRNLACCFCAVWVLWHGGGVAVAMGGYRSANRCSGRTVGYPELHVRAIAEVGCPG
jgi:hypothetical protein